MRKIFLLLCNETTIHNTKISPTPHPQNHSSLSIARLMLMNCPIDPHHLKERTATKKGMTTNAAIPLGITSFGYHDFSNSKLFNMVANLEPGRNRMRDLRMFALVTSTSVSLVNDVRDFNLLCLPVYRTGRLLQQEEDSFTKSRICSEIPLLIQGGASWSASTICSDTGEVCTNFGNKLK